MDKKDIFKKLEMYKMLEEIPRSFEKKLMLNKIMRCVYSWGLKGDYLEFGIYRGNTFVQAYELANKYSLSKMNFYAFDSFKGLPEPSKNEKHKFHEGQYSCSVREFNSFLKDNDIDMNRVNIMPGFFDEVLKDSLKEDLGLKKASVVWIDCDLYKSTAPVLDFIKELVYTGSFLVFDDWFSFAADPLAGEIKATQEFLKKHKDIKLVEYERFHTVGKVFLVQKNMD